MKRGSILPLLVFLLLACVLGYGGYYYYQNYSKTPTKITLDTANSIPKYPNAKKWEIKPTKNVCFQKAGDCSQPATITFDSLDDWSQIYGYYARYMGQFGWTNNSSIVTSIPTSIVFNKAKGKCQSTLASKSDAGSLYEFTVTCQQ